MRSRGETRSEMGLIFPLCSIVGHLALPFPPSREAATRYLWLRGPAVKALSARWG